MTINTTSNKAQWQGNGSTTVFPFAFEVGSVSQTALTLSSGGSVTTIPPSSYSVSGLGSPNGGTITYPLSGSPIATGTTLTLIRTVPLQQLTDLVNQSNYFPDAVEGGLDYLTMALQQVAQQVAYALQTPESDPVLNLILPAAAARANMLAGFDINGNAQVYPITASVGAGNLTAELGSNGHPGFKAGTDFTVGQPSVLTLSKSYGSVANVFAAWDSNYKERDSYQIVGNQIQFGSWSGNTFVVGTWPNTVANVDVVGGTTLSLYVPPNGSVGPTQLQSNAVGDGQLAWGAILNRTCNNLTDLASLNPAIYIRAFASGFGAAGDGGGGFYVYSTSVSQSLANGATIVKSTFTGATGVWLLQFGTFITAAQFGIFGDAATVNTTQLSSLTTWLAAQSYKPEIIFGQGVYLYTSSPNFAISHARFTARGEVRLRNTGTGSGVILDAGSGSQNVYDVTFGTPGNPFIVEVNSATASNAVYLRGVHHSTVAVKPRSAGASSAGLAIYFAVCTTFYVTCSVNEDGGWYGGSSAKPTYGIYATQRNAGEATSYCRFVNPIIEGPTYGIYFDFAGGNLVDGGTCEDCTNTGIFESANAFSNVFRKMDMEVNTTSDIDSAGLLSHFDDCDTNKIIHLRGNDQLVSGGVHSQITFESGALHPRVEKCRVNRNNDGSTITDSSATNTAVWHDVVNYAAGTLVAPPAIFSIGISTSPTSYTNNTSRDVDVTAQGGTITSITLTRGATTVTVASGTSVNAGWCRTSPGDTVSVNWSSSPTGVYGVPR